MTYHNPPPHSFPKPSLYPMHLAITVRLCDASDDLLVRHVRLLRDCVALAQQRWGFVIVAASVLPSEIQLLCRFPDANVDVLDAVKLICSAFDRHVPGHVASVWAADIDVIEVTVAAIPLRRVFVEAAPVRAGLVKNAVDWPYSSAHAGTAQPTEIGVAVA